MDFFLSFSRRLGSSWEEIISVWINSGIIKCVIEFIKCRAIKNDLFLRFIEGSFSTLCCLNGTFSENLLNRLCRNVNHIGR